MGGIKEISGFVNIRDWLPYPYKPVLLKTKYGLRVGFCGIFGSGFTLTDCTHSLQNAFMSIYDISSWKYINEEDSENLLFTKNTWMRKSEADEILRHIPKQKTLLNKIYQWLIKVLK